MKLSSILSPTEAEELKRAVNQWCRGECSKCPLKLGRFKYACSMIVEPTDEYPDYYYNTIINNLVEDNINLPFIRSVSVTEEDIISVFKK